MVYHRRNGDAVRLTDVTVPGEGTVVMGARGGDATEDSRRSESSRPRVVGAMPSDVRLCNRSAVLSALYPDVLRSRADLAKITGLSKVSTSDVVSDLIGDGFVVEQGYKASSRPGKPALMLEFNPSARRIVALDLSDPASIKGVVTDLAGTILDREERDSPLEDALDPESVLGLCSYLCTRVANEGTPLLGIGVATPGTVDGEGTVLTAPNLGWESVHLGELIRTRFGVPVHVANDADAAVRAERHFGSGPSDMIVVQVARGVGAGVLIADRVVGGSGFAAGEIGHVVVDPDGPLCSCGKRGCLETLISAHALRRRIQDAPRDRETILSEAGAVLGRALSMPVGMTDVTDIVVSGPSDIVDDAFLEGVRDAVDAAVHSRFIGRVVVRRPRLGGDAAVLGVVASLLREELGVIA